MEWDACTIFDRNTQSYILHNSIESPTSSGIYVRYRLYAGSKNFSNRYSLQSSPYTIESRMACAEKIVPKATAWSNVYYTTKCQYIPPLARCAVEILLSHLLSKLYCYRRYHLLYRIGGSSNEIANLILPAKSIVSSVLSYRKLGLQSSSLGCCRYIWERAVLDIGEVRAAGRRWQRPEIVEPLESLYQDALRNHSDLLPISEAGLSILNYLEEVLATETVNKVIVRTEGVVMDLE